jgi:hypothetical protein
MRSGGFIFSLDAFVAFTLTMVTVSLLIFTIGTPKPYYPSLEQAHELAYDTLQTLSAASQGDSCTQTYLEQVLAGGSCGLSGGDIMRRVAGGDPSYRGIIPKGFGFRLETYDFAAGNWNPAPLYDSSTDPLSDRSGKNFSKLQASATVFSSFYSTEPRRGESQYCYLSCFGYQPDGTYSQSCNATPCDRPISDFLPGENSVQLVRLVVYT